MILWVCLGDIVQNVLRMNEILWVTSNQSVLSNSTSRCAFVFWTYFLSSSFTDSFRQYLRAYEVYEQDRFYL